MIKEGNADSKWSEKKMEKEDSVRRVDCLRGRLQAERVASKNAKDEAEQLENKLTELENLLKEEAKSRNRAEKKLKLLIKKLESMNMSYVPEDKSDFSSESSTTSSSKEASKINSQFKISTMSENQESPEESRLSKGTVSPQQNYSPISILSQGCGYSSTEGSSTSAFELESQECEVSSNENTTSSIIPEYLEQEVAKNVTSDEDSLTSEGELSSQKPSPVESDQSCNGSKTYQPSVESPTEHDREPDDVADTSMALVLFDAPDKTHETVDPEVLDASVKEVLEALRRAKEQLQSSMDRKRMNIIKVG